MEETKSSFETNRGQTTAASLDQPNPPKPASVLPPVIPSPPQTPGRTIIGANYVSRSPNLYAGPERRLPNNSPYDGTERRIRYTDGKKIIEIKSDQVSLSIEEEQRIKDALDLLAKDAHAPRDIMVRMTLHIFNEWPKTLHKNSKPDKDGNVTVQSRSVKNAEEESKAATDGFGKYELADPAKTDPAAKKPYTKIERRQPDPVNFKYSGIERRA